MTLELILLRIRGLAGEAWLFRLKSLSYPELSFLSVLYHTHRICQALLAISANFRAAYLYYSSKLPCQYLPMFYNDIMLKSLNKVVKVLIISDFFFLFGWGLVTPILAIFILESIQGGDVKVAGIAVGIYWIGKSIIQIPVAKYLDRNHGEKDDYLALVFGTFLASLVPLGFIWASLPWHMYVLQGIFAVGAAMALPSWAAIFTRHIDKGQEAFSWGLDSSALGLGAGIAGIIGGTVAKDFGFTYLFIGVSVLGIIATLSFLLIKNNLLPKTKKQMVYPVLKP